MSNVGIFSAKGGVGKTTLTANLGASLVSEFNKSVCLVDGNVSAANLGLHFGLYYSPVTLYDVLNSRIPINTAVYIHPSGVRILPSPISAHKVGASVRNLRRHMDRLVGYDHIIMDSSPSLSTQTLECLNAVDQALIVTTPDAPAVTDASKMAVHAERSGLEFLGLVVNRVRNRNYELTMDEIESISGLDIAGIIPENENVQRCISEGTPEVLKNPYSDFSIEVNMLAAEIFRIRYSPPSTLDKIKFWLGLKDRYSMADRARDNSEPMFQKNQRSLSPRDDYRLAAKRASKTPRAWKTKFDKDEYTGEVPKEVEDKLKKEIMGMLRDSIREKIKESVKSGSKK
ncbi:MAG: AAA family ATPase [Candidatus Aenigmarchaeota archaeon]|nr:AAA family ATPase [Candidatus Aenigmarchaeota archaeon]